MKYTLFATLSLVLAASARPSFIREKRADFTLKNGQDAIALNENFKTLTPTSKCTKLSEVVCVNNQFARCAKGGRLSMVPCLNGEVCAALPLVDSAGTTVECTTAAKRDALIAATGAKAAASGNQAASNNAAAKADATGDPQKSLTLSAKNVQPNYAQDGSKGATAGQEPSLTSTNNFINFCLDFSGHKPTNGEQILAGSCNQTPMGIIAAKTNMPSAKFQVPANGDKLAANKEFTIKLAISNLETGHFTNPTTTFHMAPQTLNAQGNVKGHSHVVIQKLTALDQKTPVDPTEFVFFKGLNDKAVNGILTTTVPGGLPQGVYRIATINSAANHQPALVAVAQRGALDDMVYFTVA